MSSASKTDKFSDAEAVKASKKQASQKNASDKKQRPGRQGPALASRLNSSSTRRLFWTFFAFDLCLIAVLGWGLLWNLEAETVALKDLYVQREAYPEVTDGITYRTNTLYLPDTLRPFGVTLHPNVASLMPAKEAVRTVVVDNSGWTGLSYNKIMYGLYFPNTGDYIRVPIREELMIFTIIMVVVFFLQLIQLMSFSVNNYTAIDHRLWPYRALVKSAQDAVRDPLHARLPRYGPSREPMELADAVNEVLDAAAEIHESYGQQARFVSDASHELRTPIAVIQGYTNMLDRWGKNDPATLDEAIQALKNEADGMQQLVEQLLFLSRGDSGNVLLTRMPIDISQVMREVYQEALMIDELHEYQMDTDGPLVIMGDAGLLKQALRILLDNSRKYTPEGGIITLSCRKVDNTARLSVEDTGIGITQQDVPRIFDRFFRADQSRDRKTGGSGLGLSIARWIIDRHQGTIEVLSRVGAGTRISYVLPLQKLGPDKL